MGAAPVTRATAPAAALEQQLRGELGVITGLDLEALDRQDRQASYSVRG